jgi:uncharacterized protein with gpF-like domain
MNEQQKLINQKLSALLNNADKAVDRSIGIYEKQIIHAYRNALEAIKKKIADMYEDYGEKVTYDEMNAYNRLAVLEGKIAEQLRELTGENIKLTRKSIKESFTESYYRTGEAMETGFNVKLGFGQLNPNVISAAILNPLDRIKWPDRLKDHVNKLNQSIQEEISQGLIEGKGYAKIARGITKRTKICNHKAITIARTESGRAQSSARVLAFEKSESAANRLGVKTTRVWVATNDGRTRDSHASMDGQEANEKGKFVLLSGVETDGPRLSGIAKEDINCRCTTSLKIF